MRASSTPVESTSSNSPSPWGGPSWNWSSFDIGAGNRIEEWPRRISELVNLSYRDEDRCPHTIGSCTKTLPHDGLGEVDPAAFCRAGRRGANPKAVGLRNESHGRYREAEEPQMSRIIRFTGVTLALAFVSIAAVQQGAPPPPTSPANGYDVHVTAPHVVDGVPMGPYHHYCKVLNADPVIQCLVFASTAPDARLEQIEYVIAKSITRTGRGVVEGLEPKLARSPAGNQHGPGAGARAAARTGEAGGRSDGDSRRHHLHLWSHDEKVPGGKVSIAQSVGHLHLSSEAFQAGAKEALPK